MGEQKKEKLRTDNVYRDSNMKNLDESFSSSRSSDSNDDMLQMKRKKSFIEDDHEVIPVGNIKKMPKGMMEYDEDDFAGEEEEKEEKKEKLTVPLKKNAEEIDLDEKERERIKNETEKKVIREYENKEKDYKRFGVGFDLDNVKITAADSSLMREVKTKLKVYLKMRKEIFETNNIKPMTAGQVSRYDKEKENKGKGYIEYIDNSETMDWGGLITESQRLSFGEAYDDLKAAIDSYVDSRSSLFKFGRGKQRLKQVKALKEQMRIDNFRFLLSKGYREKKESLDYKYINNKHDNFRFNLMPTWMHAMAYSDKIKLRNQAYREKREKQRENGTLPNVFKRMAQWVGMATGNNVLRTLVIYSSIGGLIDRTLGLGTMIAANGLELAGKIVKAPIKLLSAMFNGISKHVFNSRKRWKVNYNLGKGWKSLDEGRRIFRRYLKAPFAAPMAVAEACYRGLPALFGHKFKSGVFKRSGKWTGAVFNDISNIFASIGIKKDYTKAMAEDMKQAGGMYILNGKVVQQGVTGSDDDDDDDDDDEGSNEEMNRYQNNRQESFSDSEDSGLV